MSLGDFFGFGNHGFASEGFAIGFAHEIAARGGDEIAVVDAGCFVFEGGRRTACALSHGDQYTYAGAK